MKTFNLEKLRVRVIFLVPWHKCKLCLFELVRSAVKDAKEAGSMPLKPFETTRDFN